MRFSAAWFKKFSQIQFEEGDINKYIQGLKTSDSVRPGFVSIYTPEEYSKQRVFTSPDGMQGFALLNHGDGRIEIAGVFNNDPKNKGAGKLAVLQGFKLGGNYLEAFERDSSKGEGFSLPEYYHKLVGAEPTGYMSFGKEYAHPQWNYTEHGEPGIVSLSVPQGAHDDPNWLNTERDPLEYRRKLDLVKEQNMKQKPAQTAKKKPIRLGYSSHDPIEAFETWENEGNVKRAKREAALAKKKKK